MGTLDRIKELTEKDCIVDFLYKEACHHKCSTCGKCVFGYEGITQLQMILKDITAKKAQEDDFSLLKDLSGWMSTQSLCEDGKEIGKAVQYSLDHFGEEFILHISKKACSAEVCSSFLTFHILASKCKGCDECVDICEDHAILGKSKYIHVIRLEDCTQCGKCLGICEQNAIVTAGLKKPKGPKKPILLRSY